jgi:curli biogenesis system outer membrane secretion channel CsgG
MILHMPVSLEKLQLTQGLRIRMEQCMRFPVFPCLIMTVSLIFSAVLFAMGNSYVYAGNEAIEDQVAGILSEESAQGKIKILVLDFSVSTSDTERKLSEKELKDRGIQYTEEFIANLMNKIRDAGKRDKIAIIDRSRLDDILREKKLPITAIPERTASEIGRLAGVDVIIAGRMQMTGNSITVTTKVVRVKDGEILDIVKQDKQEKSFPIAHAPVTILEGIEELKIGSYKALPLNVPSGGTLSVTIDVIHGNPIDINVIPGSELDNFKGRKKFNSVADFTAAKMKSYKRSAHLDSGGYYLVLRDSSLGIFTAQSSKLKIMVQLEP